MASKNLTPIALLRFYRECQLAVTTSRRPHALVTIGFTLLLGFAGEANGWNSDLHFSLTKWLAVQAGFSKENATLIAQGANSYDTSKYTDAIGNVVYVCLSGSVADARELQRRHFPTDALFPSPPL